MPKTYGDLWPIVMSWNNLYAAYLEAARGKRYRPEVLKFAANLEENLINIQNHLYWKTWTPGRWREFIVHEPKIRHIQAPPFKDRVVHHALVRVIEPLFERKFIYDSYACRVGKGTHTAVLRTQEFLRRAKAEWDQTYVLKADISKYFPSIRHDPLLRIVKRTIRDKDILWLCETIIRNCGENGRGIPVGALTSQLFANIYLDRLDHFIKDELGIKFYTRYMDDWIIFCDTKKQLWSILDLATDFLTFELGLRLNPKTSAFPAGRGVDFCGYRIWTTHLLPRKRNVKRARRRFCKFIKLYSEGYISLEKVRASVMSFLGYMKHCSGFKTTESVLGELVLRKKKIG
ncbi:MAG: group II intron reverse transcriptase domain-containing protein [Deltaproteobacteria bacterium]|nr:group II intron reverse transcriptase domain-containing protein [Deltaproteobacteria bacterium]